MGHPLSGVSAQYGSPKQSTSSRLHHDDELYTLITWAHEGNI